MIRGGFCDRQIRLKPASIVFGKVSAAGAVCSIIQANKIAWEAWFPTQNAQRLVDRWLLQD